MKRYLRLLYYFFKFSAARSLQFRMDFFFRIIMDSIFYAVNILFFHIIYSHTTAIVGWDIGQVLVFISCYFIVDALYMSFSSTNIWWLPQFINKGDLDYYLTRPVSSLFFLSFKDFSINSMINLFIAVGIFIFSVIKLDTSISFSQYFWFVLLMINGYFIHHMLALTFIIPTFWFHKSDGLMNVYFTATRFAERPHRIYRGITRIIITTVLPFAFIASFPAQILLEGLESSIIIRSFITTSLLFILVVLFWRAGLRSYSSASS